MAGLNFQNCLPLPRGGEGRGEGLHLLLALISSWMLGCGAMPALPDAGQPVDSGVVSFSDGGLDLNDVSWLLPLPAPAQHGLLLGLSSAGSKGPLLPRRHYDALPGLVTTEDADALFAKFQVISARIDPCFPKEPTSGCLQQIRLVAQPLLIDGFKTTTEDGTLHLFYELTDAEFDDARADAHRAQGARRRRPPTASRSRYTR